MLDEMKEKFEDSFTDEEKIQIFNLIFSGYYSLSYIKFLAQKKAGRDLGIDVKEPQTLLPPEGEGADYDDYLDAVLRQPNKESVLENLSKDEEKHDDVNSENDVKIEMPSIPENDLDSEKKEEENSISDSPISSSPIEESSLSGGLDGEVGPDSSLEEDKEESEDKSDIPEGFTPTKVDEDSALNVAVADDSAVEEKEPLTPTLPTDEKEDVEQSGEEESSENKTDDSEEENKTDDNEEKNDDVITFGFGDNNAGEAHEPTIEVIQEDTRPKKEEAAPEIKIVAPTEDGGSGQDSTPSSEAVVLPTATPEEPASTIPMPEATDTPVAQPSQEVPTISLADLTNPQPTQPAQTNQTVQTTQTNQ